MLKTKGYSTVKPSQKPCDGWLNYRKDVTIVELLRWAYQDEQIDAMSRPGGVWLGGGVDSLTMVAERKALGCRVDGGGYGVYRTHPDAEAVHEAVRRLPGRQVGLVIRHAKAGTRPDWMPGAAPRVEPVRRPNGKVVIERDRHRHHKAPWCPFRIDPLPEHIAMMRAIYVEWWHALAALADRNAPVGRALTERLERHNILPFCEPKAPWIVETC